MTAFTNSVTHVVAGNSATTLASFMVPDIFQLVSSGFITFDLIDADNAVYSSGNGINYTVTADNEANFITADCAITVPSNIPVTTVGTNYQIRYTLTLPDEEDQEFFIYTSLIVLPPTQVELGAIDKVEIAGGSCVLNLITQDAAVGPVTVDIYLSNMAVSGFTGLVAAAPINLADGYQYDVAVNTLGLTPALVPYTAIWNYTVNGVTLHQSASLFAVTPSIMAAMSDILLTINKSRAHFGYQPVFNPTEVVSYLRLGADYFNGLFLPTMFTMTNATGPVRYFWLQCSAIVALRAQYLMEGESAFDFSGQSISLNVDRSQFYDSMAGAIDSQIQEPLRQLKANLSKRGLTSGDGNVNPLAIANNAIGTIGISNSPVSNLRTSNVNWLFGGRGSQY